jgi:hypothetical protein
MTGLMEGKQVCSEVMSPGYQKATPRLCCASSGYLPYGNHFCGNSVQKGNLRLRLCLGSKADSGATRLTQLARA